MKALLSAVLLMLLAACATTGTGAGLAAIPEIPADATEAVRTSPNGDVITEYRVADQVRVVKVQPPRGPAYYLYSRDGQIISTQQGDNPPQPYFRLFEWGCRPGSAVCGGPGHQARAAQLRAPVDNVGPHRMGDAPMQHQPREPGAAPAAGQSGQLEALDLL